MEEKAAIRKRIREMRSAMTADAVRERSLAAQRHILASEEWREAPSVGVYAAVHNEIDTALLVESAWQEGKEVFFPYSLPAGVMYFLPCHGWRELVKSRMGILEPSPELCPPPPSGGWVPRLIIVPAVALDWEGYRLGIGGGYYDRFFAKHSAQDAIRVGFAYAFQVLDNLPAEEWDAPMHAVATEEALVWL